MFLFDTYFLSDVTLKKTVYIYQFFFFYFNVGLFPKKSSQSRCKGKLGDFPGGAVVKNPPANAGDTGLSPGLGRSHMPWSN